MKGTEPLYDFYKRTLTNAGWIKADTGTKASTQSAAGGIGAGKAGTTTSKLPAATTKTPWSTSGTVDGVAGASVSMASPKGGNYNTALREAQQMANNGYDMAQITEYLIREKLQRQHHQSGVADYGMVKEEQHEPECRTGAPDAGAD